MIQEEIARLTGTLKFNVDNRPLMAFEKRLNGVMTLLREFSTLANKKYTIKVALDGRSLRAQIDKAANAKISLKNIEASNEALAAQSQRIKNYLEKTPINMKNIRVDIKGLVDQKKLTRTMLGQMEVNLKTKFNMFEAERDLRRNLREIENRNRLRIKAEVNTTGLVAKIRSALRQAERQLGQLKIKVGQPQLSVTVNKQKLLDDIRSVLRSAEFEIRVKPTRGAGGSQGAAGGGGRGQIDRGLSAAMGFARGALPGLGAAFAVGQLNKINQEMQAQQLAMTAVMGSEQAGKEQTAWLRNLANTIGFDYRQVGPSFNKMLASGKTSGMSTESVQNIFQGVSEYGRVMGLDSEAMKGSMRAIEQMMNKGQVMSEELKGQLAERMPGAMSAMAEAAGFGTGDDAVAKLMDAMKNGNVKSKAVLEQFGKILAERARSGGALAKAMEATAAQQARMMNAFSNSVERFSQGGFDSAMGGFFKTAADAMERAAPLVTALGEAFKVLIQPLDAIIRILGVLGENWGDFADALGMTKGQLATLASAIAVFMLPFGGFVVAVSAAALVIDDLLTYMRGGKSVFGDWVANTEGAQGAIDNLVFAFDGLQAAWDDLKSSMPDSDVFKNLSIDQVILDGIKQLSDNLEFIAKNLKAISELMNGDWKRGIIDLGTNYRDFLTVDNPAVKAWKATSGKILSGGLELAGQGVDFVKGRAGLAPQLPPQPTGIFPMQQPNVTVQGITLEIHTAATDAQGIGEDFKTHIKDMTVQAMRDAFGQMRANQAERR